ncbi:MAG: hypothetical protein E7566_01145 [Ruminococcaceae bacterium]|nr:hypothetical protein [Oscillospiraceae bacterium]
MRKNIGKTYSLAFASVIAALSLVFMFITTFIPIGTYALPCIAGAMLAAVVLESGYISAFVVYFVVSVLSVLLVGDKEAVLYYIVFLGFYPIVKGLFERIKLKPLQYALKFILFNVCIVSAFFIGISVLSIPKESFELFGVYLPWVFLIMGNIVFIIYDICLTRIITQYANIWRKKIKFK